MTTESFLIFSFKNSVKIFLNGLKRTSHFLVFITNAF
ncbi:hypothetical protein L935_02050 [Helicobacter pylori PZ5086]|nr:hypothetical protein L935_02050 [Helicobacter pylori PZ5086]